MELVRFRMAAETVGTVCESVIQEGITFEWKINNFLQLGDFMYMYRYRSPEFYFSDATWVIYINPYGDWTNLGYIGLFLHSMSLLKYFTVNMTLSFKDLNGKSDLEHTSTKFIDKKGCVFNRPKVITREDLIRRKSELLPSGILTVICTLKNMELNVVNEQKFLDATSQTEERIERKFLDASVQTEKIMEWKLPDASTQTEEGTGVWKLQKHLHEISLSGDVSDIILKVEGQEFKSHRCILAARSPVFSAMVKNEMKENVTGVVDIPDIDSKTFLIFLNYLYTGSTKDLTSENATKLYTTADKYQVDVLKEICLDHMMMNVSVGNFCDVFTISIQHNEEKLKETCIEFFGKHLLDIIETCKWQSFLCENPILCNELHIKQAKLNNKKTST